jgi:glycerol uptake facilitator-like aquaporin
VYVIICGALFFVYAAFSFSFASIFAANVGSAALLLVIAFMDYEKRYAVVGLLITINPISMVSRSGYCVNPLDFAPR